MHWKTVLRYAKNDAQVWKGIDLNDGTVRTTTGRQNQSCEELRRWNLPTNGRIKCNVDGSFRNANTEATAGWLYRNEEGQYQGALQARGRKVSTALEGELQAILMAINTVGLKAFARLLLRVTAGKLLISSLRRLYISMSIIGHEKYDGGRRSLKISHFSGLRGKAINRLIG